MRLWLGVATFVAGAIVWFLTGASFGPAARRARTGAPPRPVWLPRFGAALSALGLSVLASTQAGVSWAVSSIGFSIVAIILLLWVLRDNLRR